MPHELDGEPALDDRLERTALDDRLEHTALGRPQGAGKSTSPQAVEATLASISDEVMDEAIARRSRPSGPKSPHRL